MKKTVSMFVHPICRLIVSMVWQLVWLAPLWMICWYAKLQAPLMIRAHFNVDQLEERLVSLDKFAEVMKNNTSFSNPAALMHYISAQFSRFSVATKLNTLEMTSHFVQTLCLWGLNLILIVATIYAIIRTIRSYRARTQVYTTVTAIAQELEPKFTLLQQEIKALHEEIQRLQIQKQRTDTTQLVGLEKNDL